ncbi:hypothetical protein EDD22DRAFT_780462, partial [Suillus occidentalis]
MDPDHKLPPVTTGQSSDPHVQQEPSPLVRYERVDNGGRPQTQSAATERPLLGSSEGHSPAGDPDTGFEPVPQPPPAARSRGGHMLRGPLQHSFMGHGRSNASGIGWIVPEVGEKPHVCGASLILQRRTIGERLAPSIVDAERERAQYARKAKWTGHALNVAIGLQVLLGALTTGISAASSGKQVS